MQPLYGLHAPLRTAEDPGSRDTGCVADTPPRDRSPHRGGLGRRIVGALERASTRLVGVGRRHAWVRAAVLHPLIARPGYWLATILGGVWGGILSLGRVRRRGGVWVARRMPRWSFGRGGTTIGAVFLTHDALAPEVLEHEARHRAQWRRYGLALLPLYLAAGQDAHTNRFEIEAGLESGGYTRRSGPRRPRRPDADEG